MALREDLLRTWPSRRAQYLTRRSAHSSGFRQFVKQLVRLSCHRCMFSGRASDQFMSARASWHVGKTTPKQTLATTMAHTQLLPQNFSTRSPLGYSFAEAINASFYNKFLTLWIHKTISHLRHEWSGENVSALEFGWVRSFHSSWEANSNFASYYTKMGS